MDRGLKRRASCLPLQPDHDIVFSRRAKVKCLPTQPYRYAASLVASISRVNAIGVVGVIAGIIVGVSGIGPVTNKPRIADIPRIAIAPRVISRITPRRRAIGFNPSAFAIRLVTVIVSAVITAPIFASLGIAFGNREGKTESECDKSDVESF